MVSSGSLFICCFYPLIISVPFPFILHHSIPGLRAACAAHLHVSPAQAAPRAHSGKWLLTMGLAGTPKPNRLKVSLPIFKTTAKRCVWQARGSIQPCMTKLMHSTELMAELGADPAVRNTERHKRAFICASLQMFYCAFPSARRRARLVAAPPPASAPGTDKGGG